MKNTKRGGWVGGLVLTCAVLTLGVCIVGLSGCSTLDRAYKPEVTWTNAPVVHVFTGIVDRQPWDCA